MPTKRSSESRDRVAEEGSHSRDSRGSRRFDAPGLSFSMSDGGGRFSEAFEDNNSVLERSDISSSIQRDPQSGCTPFFSSTPEKSRRKSVVQEMAESSSAKKTKDSSSRKSTIGTTATNIFNFLYAQEVDQSTQSFPSTLDRTVSDSNTKSTFGDITMTGDFGTSATETHTKSLESVVDSAGRSSITQSFMTSKTSLTARTPITNGTTHSVCSPPPPPPPPQPPSGKLDPVQRALHDLAATPIPHNIQQRQIKSALKTHGVTKAQISNGLNKLERRGADDSSETAIVTQPEGTADPSIEIERVYSAVAPPVLHQFCLAVTKAPDLLKAVDLVTASGASEPDAIGRLAMHCLSDNIALAEALAYPEDIPVWSSPETKQKPNAMTSPMSQTSHTTRRRSNRGTTNLRGAQSPSSGTAQDLEEAVISFVVKGLLKAYPAAMISPDALGQIPFESILRNWVEQSLEIPSEDGQGVRKRKFSAEQFPSVSALWQRTSSLWSSREIEQVRVQTNSTDSSGTRDVEGGKNQHDKQTDVHFPTHIKLSAQVYFAVKVLSAIMDALESGFSPSPKPTFMSPASSLFSGSQTNRDSSLKGLEDTTSSDIRSEIVQSVASIPALMKVILLLEDEDQRNFLMSTTLMKSVVSHPASVGSWLTHMLQSGERRVVDRALDYVNLVSSDGFWLEMTPQDNRLSKQTSVKMDQRRGDLYDKVSQLPNFVPSLLSLGGRSIEEASTTKMVRRVLDRIIARPFCATFIFCDALFLAIMIVGFRMAVYRLIMNEAPGNILRYIYISNMGTFYFVIRELGKAVSLSMMNRHARLYFLSFWNACDLLATFLTLSSTIFIRLNFPNDSDQIVDETVPYALRYLLTVTTGCLWLRVLSFLKGINMQLATFVLAILQISKDVIWFCVIVITLLVSFGQMFFTLMAPDTCGAEPEEPSCRQSEYYLKMYSMLIFQEFDRDSYDSVVSVVLVVLYSFIAVLVLLNVLIAVASDSYEKCLVRSQNLFGRARVMMISEMVSFQSLLRRNSGEVSALAIYKAWWSKDSASGWSRGSLIFFGLSSVIVLVWVVAELSGYFTGPGYGNMMMSLGSILVTVFLFVCIMLFLSIGAGNETNFYGRNGKKLVWNGRLSNVASRFESLVHGFVLGLLGSSVNQGTLGLSSDAAAEEEWSGRIHYLKKEMNRIADDQRALTADQVEKIEMSLYEEVAKLQCSFESLKQEITKPSAVAPEDIPSMLGVAIEALQKVQKTMR